MRRHAMLVTCVVVLFLAGVSTNAAPIHDAAAKGDLAKCKSLLGKDPKLVSATDKDGATPLHHAVAGGHQPVVELLLTKKADVNAKKKDGVTPLHVAAALGRVEIAKALIANGADAAATDKQGRTPLSLAQEKGQTEIAALLEEKGATEGVSGAKALNTKDGAEMVLVPAGSFLMGSTDNDLEFAYKMGVKVYGSFRRETSSRESPQHSVFLDSYLVYKYEVTVAQYRQFCEQTSRSMPKAPKYGWHDDRPIVNVSYDDAAAYAKWAGCTLPTEAQWEKAARGADGRLFPWGNEWDNSRCLNTETDGGDRSPRSVGSYRSGVSPYGCYDMAGNAWEICSDWVERKYSEESVRNPVGPAKGKMAFHVLRGGGGYSTAYTSRCAYRVGSFLGGDQSTGFRCVQVVKN